MLHLQKKKSGKGCKFTLVGQVMTPSYSAFANILNYSHKPNHCLIIASFIVSVFLIIPKIKLVAKIRLFFLK